MILKLHKIFVLAIGLFAAHIVFGQKPNYTANNMIAPYTGYFAYGSNPGYFGGYNNNRSNDKLIADLSKNINLHTTRQALPDDFLEAWGINVRLSEFQYYTETLGMHDLTVSLEGPSDAHRETVTINCGVSQKRSLMFKNMYEPIWDDNINGTPINDNNYFAAYIYKVVTTYGSHVKFYEIWNEPDLVNNSAIPTLTRGQAGNWWENNPSPCDLVNLNASVTSYIRLMRIAYEVIKSQRPDALVTTGAIGYDSFLDAILRNTDAPDGTVNADYPLKGGAYFDVINFQSYPQYELSAWDNGCSCMKYSRHSDNAANKVIALRDKFDVVLKKYGYDGMTFPKKYSILTETNIPGKTNVGKDHIGSAEAQRNFAMKMFVLTQKYDIKQSYIYTIGDGVDESAYNPNMNGFDMMGLYYNLNKATPATATPKDAGIAVKSLAGFLYGYTYNPASTATLNLPNTVDGGAFVKGSEIRYVLWVKTNADQIETPSAISYTFPVGTQNIVSRAWNFANTNITQTISGTVISLTGSPQLISVSNLVSSANDNCTNPVLLTYGATATSGTTVNATASGQTSCSGIADDDVWFSFTPTVSSNTFLKLTESVGFDGVVQITSNCGSTLTQIACVDNTTGGGTETLVFPTIAGTTYYARVHDVRTGITGTFTIQVAIQVKNDECTNATTLVYEAAPVSSTTLNATASGQPVCTGVADDDVWYKFTPTVTSNTLVTLGSSAAFNGVIQISSTCGTTLAQLVCINNTISGGIEKAVLPTTAGVTYYARIYDVGTGTPGTFTISLNNSVPVANDDCASATLLAVDAPELYTTTGLATPSTQAPCRGIADDDVWYKFTPTVTGKSLIKVREATGFDAVLQISSNCGSTLTQLACVDVTDGNGVESVSLVTTAGVTYYIRVYDYGTGFPFYPNFAISVVRVLPEVNIKQVADIMSGTSYSFDNMIGVPVTFTIENKALEETLILSGSPKKIVISGTNATDFIVNETLTAATVAAGASTTFTVTFQPQALGVKNAVISIANNDVDENPYTINLSGIYTNYTLGNVTAFCGANNSYCLPLKAVGSINYGVIGLDFAINYNTSMFTPVGTATTGPVATAYGTYSLNTSTPGKVYVTVFLNAAPVNTYMYGLGDIICVDFNLATGALPGSTAVFTCDPVIESYPLSTLNMGPARSSNFSYVRGMVGQLYYRNSTAVTSTITNVTGATTTRVRIANTDCGSLGTPASIVNTIGQVSADITGVSKIIIDRDILGDVFVPTITCANIQSVVGAADRNMAAQISNSTLVSPSLYELIAADVNMDGKVTAGDAALISQRSINSGYCEFPQTFNYTWNGTAVVPSSTYTRSKDWVFIDQATLANPTFIAGMNKNNVPKVPECLVASIISPVCTTKADVTYQAVLLGDVNGSWINTNSSVARIATVSEVVIDVFNAVYLGNNVYKIPVRYTDEDNFYGLDMSIDYTGSDLNILSVSKNAALNNIENAWNDIDDRKLMLTCFSENGTNTALPVLYIEAKSPHALTSLNDLGNIKAYLNEQPVKVRVAENDEVTSVNNASALNNIKLYPNPASDKVTIEGITLGYTVKIYNALGVEVYQNNNSIQEIDITELSSGMYFLKLQSNLGEKTISFIKAK